MRRIRVSVLVLCEGADTPRVLTVRHPSTGTWSLPGAEVSEGEAIPDAGALALARQTGLVLRLARVLALDHAPGGRSGGEPDTLHVVLDGGVVREERARMLVRLPSRTRTLPPVRWASPAEMGEWPGCFGHALAASARGAPLPVLVNGVSDVETARTGRRGTCGAPPRNRGPVPRAGRAPGH
ncbi:hypothetical protein [Streptomyces sp. CNQ085]|uniref:hypothetical protein n=1 Tax=Streptomyces sp. CNQ085 TaxID=2886944 RepID=UPI001F505886|nr:hypothetical protein [Streptomyces sp. CNQ085]MCI0386625.1 hypothetical protein [Streptomyces sp. CNQ085]